LKILGNEIVDIPFKELEKPEVKGELKMENKKIIDKEIIGKSLGVKKKGGNPQMKMCGIAGGVVVILVILIFLGMSIVNVPAGHKGVIVDGFDVGNQLDEGWQLKNPFSGVEMVRYNTQFKKEEISILTNDGYNVPVDVQVVYHIVEDKVSDVRIDNPEYGDTVIMNQLRSKVRTIVANLNFSGEDINTKRSILENQLELEIKENLASYHIILEDVNIRNVDLPYTILEATEQRQAAKVAVQTAEYNLQAAQYNAEQKVIVARAEYNVTVIEARSQAESQRILANQSEEMNDTVMEFIKFMKWVSMLKDPDCNVEFYVVPEGMPVILDPNAKR